MNAITKEEQTALTLPERAAVALGAADYEVKIKAKVAASTDITAVIDPAGREQAHRIGMDLLKLRTGITAAGEAARKDATAFSRAVIAKEKELVGLITPEETRVMSLRDGWDEKIATEKAAKIAAERARVEAIQGRIEAIRRAPLAVVGESSAAILVTLELVRDTIIDDSFEELKDQAMAARSEAFNALEAAHAKAIESEAAAIAAEEARKAEAARIEAERAELAQLRAAAAETARLAAIENERIANEQAAERQRLANLAAAQEAEACRVREQAAANLKAERDAQELAMRLQREKSDKEQAERDRVAADTKRQLDEQAAQIAADRKAMEDDRAEAVKLIADHADALIDNAQFDIDREANCARLQSLADQHLADKRDLPPPESCCARDARINSGEEDGPSDEDIIEFGLEWELDLQALVARMERFVVDQRELAEAIA